MTDTYEEFTFNSNYLVSVRAQVMVRDDSTGGWVPMGGGGLSDVSVRKCSIPCGHDQFKNEYLIFGKRISDQSVVLSCVIKKDFEYNKVMPTFHHWKTGDKKFGLTFQTAADARAFDKGLRTAVDELLDGIAEKSSACQKSSADVGDDEVFMVRFESLTVDLPKDSDDSLPPADSAPQEAAPTPTMEEQLSQFFNRSKVSSDEETPSQLAKYSYMHLTSIHDYMYSDVEDAKLVQQEPSSGGTKKKSAEPPPPAPSKSPKKQKRKFGRHQCRYCQEFYLEENNKRGSCEYAPDLMQSTVDELACLRCARCMLYHCMADEEGDFAQHPCECNTEEGCGRRWMGIALLSIFVPCLWFYPPLKLCHLCCIRCGLCGGRHRPAS